MFYFLYQVLYNEFGILRVFKYITIRTGGAFITGFLIFLIFGNGMLKFLKKKNIGDKVKVYFDGKHNSKEGTPTMGGIFIFLATIITVLLWGNFSNQYILLLLLGSTMSFLIGFFDDYKKLINKRSGDGISSKIKFSLLFVAALIIGILLYRIPDFNSELLIPIFKHLTPDLGIFYILLIVIVLLSTSNSVNLTDGLDGLAISLSIVSISALVLIAYFTGNVIYAEYLNIPFITNVGEITIYGGALVGVGFGFLWYNFYPAQVFMGDSGSLHLGFVIGMMAIMVKQELLLILIGGLFMLETMSVILQVSSLKIFGKRMFKMAPIHHHFEKKNIPESKIVIRFVIIAILLSLIAFVTIKVR